jgi:pSer/pThr/pTyr-binding forkhead associated (FHA) protein
VIIGREPTNELMIADPHLSRHHARLDLVDGVWMLDDMGSTLGTTLNGVLVRTPVALNDGDLIVFGRTIEVRFVNE